MYLVTNYCDYGEVIAEVIGAMFKKLTFQEVAS